MVFDAELPESIGSPRRNAVAISCELVFMKQQQYCIRVPPPENSSMRILGLIALISLSAVLAAQAVTPVQQGNGIVTGQIHSTNGASVAGVRITAMAVLQPGVAAMDAATLERLTTTDNDGRYHLENVSPGRYYITAGLLDLPTYYPGVRTLAEARTVAVIANSTLTGIDFPLAQSTGVRVSGQIKGLPGAIPDGFVRVTLVSTNAGQRGGQPIEALVSPNGRFEFQKVLPGTYSVRTNPLNLSPPPMIQIEVKDADTTIELTAGPLIIGQVTVEDGSRLPVPLNPGTAGMLNASPPLPSAMIASLMQLIGVRDTGTRSTAPFGPRSDGAMLVSNLSPGEWKIAARLPFGYSIKSMFFGDTDLLRAPLKIPDAASATGNLRVVLTTSALPNTDPGVKVSGRVTGGALPPNSWIRMQSGFGFFDEGGVGETMLRPDGTFEFQRVPPGVYSARVLPPQGMSPQIAVVVSDLDVTNVEVPNMPPPAAAAGAPASALGAATFPGMPAPLAVQPPTYPPGVTVTGHVSMESAAAAAIPQTVVLFGPRDGLSVQGPILGDGTFEIQNVPPGNYDARTLPLMMPSVSTRVVVGDKEVSGVTLNAPGARPNP